MFNVDETEYWEDAIDKDGVAKLKYPIDIKDKLGELDLNNMLILEIEVPANKKKPIMKIIGLTKKNKKIKKGLF